MTTTKAARDFIQLYLREREADLECAERAKILREAEWTAAKEKIRYEDLKKAFAEVQIATTQV